MGENNNNYRIFRFLATVCRDKFWARDEGAEFTGALVTEVRKSVQILYVSRSELGGI